MKIKLIGTLGLSAVLLLSGCGGGANTTNTNANTNANRAAATPTPIVVTNAAANTDPNLKPKIEKALADKGFKEVTVDMSGPKMVARGSVAKGKMGEMSQIITTENGGKPFDNQVTEK